MSGGEEDWSGTIELIEADPTTSFSMTYPRAYIRSKSGKERTFFVQLEFPIGCLSPSAQPSGMPSKQPTIHPTEVPTEEPSEAPSMFPTEIPSSVPTPKPSYSHVPSIGDTIRLLTLPKTTTEQLVHGICLTAASNSSSAIGIGDDGTTQVTYTYVEPFVSGTLGWDDRRYKLYGVENTPCHEESFLRPSKVEEIALGSTISINAVRDPYDDENDWKVCVFLVKDGIRDGGYFSSLILLGFSDVTVTGFYWHSPSEPLDMLCKDLDDLSPTKTPSSVPTLTPSYSHVPSIGDTLFLSPTFTK